MLESTLRMSLQRPAAALSYDKIGPSPDPVVARIVYAVRGVGCFHADDSIWRDPGSNLWSFAVSDLRAGQFGATGYVRRHYARRLRA